jgi:hypothetical protein
MLNSEKDELNEKLGSTMLKVVVVSAEMER